MSGGELRLELAPEPGSARLSWPGGGVTLRSRPVGVEMARPLRADPFVPLAFIDALRHGRTLRIEGPVSPRLVEALPQVARVYRSWRPEWPEARDVIAETRTVEATASGVGCLFSGGIDSFHTLLRHKDEITALIVIHGFDVRLEDVALRERTAREAREVADALGLELLEVESNARAAEPWSRAWIILFGAALAGAGLALSRRLRKVFVPASDYGVPILPNGSHPDTDPLWSTEAVEFVHDGCEVPRTEKTRLVAENPMALARLRCCAASWVAGAFNCGRCEKCLRTMAGLRACGALERATTFDVKFDPWYLARLPLDDAHKRRFAEDNLAAAEAAGDAELARALRELLSQKHWKPWRQWLGRIRRRIAPRPIVKAR